jgi:hypothetical protein
MNDTYVDVPYPFNVVSGSAVQRGGGAAARNLDDVLARTNIRHRVPFVRYPGTQTPADEIGDVIVEDATVEPRKRKKRSSRKTKRIQSGSGAKRGAARKKKSGEKKKPKRIAKAPTGKRAKVRKLRRLLGVRNTIF